MSRGRPKSGLSRQELQAKSDAKRGVRLQGFKLHEEVISLLDILSEQTGLSKTQIVTQGILPELCRKAPSFRAEM